MKLNKIFYLILALAMVFSLASCQLFQRVTNKSETFTVEFNTDGGSAVEKQEVAKGELAIKPEDPTKDGFTFLGWFFGDAQWSFDTPVTENLTLTARWESNAAECKHVDKDDDNKCDTCGADFSDGYTRYSITYMDGTTKLRLTPNTYNVESKGLELPAAPEKAHFIFIGWYEDAAFEKKAESIDVTAARNLTFYAKYEPVSYTITYMLDEGVNAEANLSTITFNDLPFTFAEPTKEAYLFKGWFTDANCTEAITEITADTLANTVVYAKWELAPVPHTVKYLDHNGELLLEKVFYESNTDQEHFCDEYEVEGLIFIGWTDSEDTNKLYDSIPAGTKTDLTLKAYFVSENTAKELTYTVDGKPVKYTFFTPGEVTKTIDYSKPGYTFSGWYDNSKLEGDPIEYIPEDATGDVILYGALTPIVYNVKFLDGETELVFELTSYTISDEPILLPEVPEKDGHIIVGWYMNGVKVTEIAANTYGDLTLEAKYELCKYTVTYILNGGENSEYNVTEYSFGSLPTLHDPLSRDGYLFAGWYTNAVYAGEAITSLESCANEDVTIYAKWIPIDNTNGGGSTLTPEDSWAD